MERSVHLIQHVVICSSEEDGDSLATPATFDNHHLIIGDRLFSYLCTKDKAERHLVDTCENYFPPIDGHGGQKTTMMSLL